VRLELEEGERQMLVMALAHLSVERPGWDDALNRIAVRIDNMKDGRAVMYDEFRVIPSPTNAKTVKLTDDAAKTLVELENLRHELTLGVAYIEGHLRVIPEGVRDQLRRRWRKALGLGDPP
jgi:hypothetical protein